MLNATDLHFLTLDQIARDIANYPTDVDDKIFNRICEENGVYRNCLSYNDINIISNLVDTYNS